LAPTTSNFSLSTVPNIHNFCSIVAYSDKSPNVGHGSLGMLHSLKTVTRTA